MSTIFVKGVSYGRPDRSQLSERIRNRISEQAFPLRGDLLFLKDFQICPCSGIEKQTERLAKPVYWNRLYGRETTLIHAQKALFSVLMVAQN